MFSKPTSDLSRLFQCPEPKKLQIREDPDQGIYVDGLSDHTVCGKDEILELMRVGELSRHYGATNMNERSSR